MSALAARRAAAAAKASRRSSPEGGRGVAATSPSPSSEIAFSSDGEEALVETSSKRRRVESSPKLKQRYFVAPATDTAQDVLLGGLSGSRAGKKRAFSPSGPAEEEGDGNADEADVESSGSSVGSLEDDMAEDEVEEGRVRWSAFRPATKGGETSRAAQLSTSTCVSHFQARRGVNIHNLPENALRDAGLLGQGPGMIISLGQGEDLAIVGVYSITVVQGSLSLLSSTLSPSHSPHAVFAPTSHPIPVLAQSPSTADGLADPRSFATLALPSTFLTVDSAGPRTVFVIREHRTGIEVMRDGAVPGFANACLEEKGSWGLRGVHPVVGSFPTPTYPYISPPSWEEALAALAPPVGVPFGEADSPEASEMDHTPPVALVRGTKRSGKSTFARAAVNSLLSRYAQVAWLECDLGQGEFGPGGVVGLWILDQPIFGPPFTHPMIPHRAHFLGAYTPLSCPDEYLAAVRHLLSVYRYEVQYPLDSSVRSDRVTDAVPLIVNTQGWVKGLGADLLQAIEEMVEPTHLFATEAYDIEGEIGEGPSGEGWISSPPPPWRDSLEVSGTSPRQVKTFTLSAAPISPLQSRHTPADMRILATMSYFHSRLTTPNSTVPITWDFTQPLAYCRPWQVDLPSPIRQMILVGEGAEGVAETDLPLALNGSVVALLERTSDEPLDVSSLVYERGRPCPDTESTTYLGLALVRSLRVQSVSPPKFTMHLLTPLPPAVLARASIIVRNGAMELPLCGMTDWKAGHGEEGMLGRPWDEVPYLDVGDWEGIVGGERRRWRRNLMRKGGM